jgi:DNA polymerase-3 subunit alpha
VERLQEVLRGHPGLADVHLRLVNGRRITVVKLDDKLRVKPSPSLHADLKHLLGPSCIS